MNRTIDPSGLRVACESESGPIDALATLWQCPAYEAAHALAHHLGLACWDTPRLATLIPDFQAWPLPQAQALRAVLLIDPSRAHERLAVVHNPFDSDL